MSMRKVPKMGKEIDRLFHRKAGAMKHRNDKRANNKDDYDLIWFACAPEIKKMGPYASQVEAWSALMGLDGIPVSGSNVWCEEA
jgi:hypothetical protein